MSLSKPWRTVVALAAAGALEAPIQAFELMGPRLRPDQGFEVEIDSPPPFTYLVFRRGETPDSILEPVAAVLGQPGRTLLRDPGTGPLGQRFYQVEAVSWEAPLDLDRDGLNDLFELTYSPAFDPLDPTDAAGDFDNDGFDNLEEARRGTDPTNAADRPRVQVITAPEADEIGVSVQREIMIEFDQPLSAETQLTPGQFFAEFGGRRILTRRELSSDRRRVWLFPLEPMPPGARIRVVFDGTGIRDALGREMDAEDDGLPGGRLEFGYTTFGATPVAGTAVVGQVFDSEPQPDGAGGFVNRPLAGVIITVDGAEQSLRTTTDATGRFRLDPAPSGRFFVQVDGRTAVGSAWPGGEYYPFVGKAWEAQPGQTNNLAGGTGIIYLPRIAPGTLQPVSATSDTEITFPPEVLSQHPDLAGVTVTVPANALFADSGARGGRVGIAPVPPDRLPEPLPVGLELPLVITIQTDGPLNFDRPVPVRFPNRPDPLTGETLPPGAKTVLWSFDHDVGRWEPQGGMTISPDGRFAETDPGVGVRQPGWHGTSPTAPIAQRAGCSANPVTVANAIKLTRDAAGCIKDLSGLGRALSAMINFINTGHLLYNNWSVLQQLYRSGNLTPAQAASVLSSIKAIKASIEATVQLFLRQNPLSKVVDAAACAASLTKTLTDIGCDSGSCLSTMIRVLCSNLQPFLNISADLTKRFQDFNNGTLSKLGAVTLALDIAIDALESRIGDTGQGASLRRAGVRPASSNEVLPYDPEVGQLIDAALAELGELLALADVDRIDAVKFLPVVEAFEQALGDQQMFSKVLVGSGVHLGKQYYLQYQRGGSQIEERGLFASKFERMVPLGQTGTLSWFDPESGLLGSMEWTTAELEPAFAFSLPPTQWLGAPPQDHHLTCDSAAACGNVPPWAPYTLRFVGVDDLPDTDGDGLPDEVEVLYGTDPLQADTDGDGVPDGLEVSLGTDPAGDTAPLPMGVIAALDTDGAAADLAAHERFTVVADSEGGLVVMAVNGLDLERTAVVPTPGSVQAVAVDGQVAVGGDSRGILTVLDLSRSADELSEPRWRISVGAPVWSVAVAYPIAFAGLDTGRLVAVDLEAGMVLDRVGVAARKVEDVVVVGRQVAVLADGVLHLFDWDDVFFHRRGSVQSPGLATDPSSGRNRLFTDGSRVFATHRGGYNVFAVTDQVPTLVRRVETGQIDWKHLITPDGTRGVAAVGVNLGLSPSDDHANLYTLDPPAGSDGFIATFPTPGAARAVVSRQGFIQVADHQSGLQVLNINPPDRTGIPPTVTVRLASGGTTTEPDQWIELIADAADNVAVREVEFLVNDDRVYTDPTFPFAHRFRAPATDTPLVVAARAVDVGGNATLSAPLSLTVLPDTTAPRLLRTSPAFGAAVGALHEIVALFSERLDPATVANDRVIVRGAGADGLFDTPDDTLPASATQTIQQANHALVVSLAAPLPPGRYRIEISPALADHAGHLVTDLFAPVFRVAGPADMTDTDRDGLPDIWETTVSGTDPLQADTNGNGIPDGDEDPDGDGLTTLFELIAGTDPTKADTFGDGRNDAERDSDGDALTLRQELLLGTDPTLADTDGDGWNDEAEISLGSRPTDPRSRPWIFTGTPPTTALARPDWGSGAGQFASPQPLGVVRLTADPSAEIPYGTSQGQPPHIGVVRLTADPSAEIPYGTSQGQPPLTLQLNEL